MRVSGASEDSEAQWCQGALVTLDGKAAGAELALVTERSEATEVYFLYEAVFPAPNDPSSTGPCA